MGSGSPSRLWKEGLRVSKQAMEGGAPGLQTGYEWEGLRVSRQAMKEGIRGSEQAMKEGLRGSEQAMKEGLRGSEQATQAGKGLQAPGMDSQTGLQDLRHTP